MPSQRFLSDVLTLAATALASGGAMVTPGRVVWKIAGNCLAPYCTEFHARPSPPRDGGKRVTVTRSSQVPMTVEIWTRCRRCEPCRRARAALWRERAAFETAQAPRTWFGTLTIRPDEHYLAQCRVRQNLEARSVPISDVSPARLWALEASALGTQVTLMLKRLRSRGLKFRYLHVTEAHKSGAPHFHMLIHEINSAEPVRYSDLEHEWPLGFSKWRLVADPKEALYLAKYLSKDARSRVRASLAYGLQTVNRLGV